MSTLEAMAASSSVVKSFLTHNRFHGLAAKYDLFRDLAATQAFAADAFHVVAHLHVVGFHRVPVEILVCGRMRKRRAI
jgi:hypothetical protein